MGILAILCVLGFTALPQLLILAGKRDDIAPPRIAETLSKASGRQRIVWYDCGRYGAIVYRVSALDDIVKHFQME
jgi:hypothetical protein